jgi:hypothetical protein
MVEFKNLYVYVENEKKSNHYGKGKMKSDAKRNRIQRSKRTLQCLF